MLCAQDTMTAVPYMAGAKDTRGLFVEHIACAVVAEQLQAVTNFRKNLAPYAGTLAL